MAGVFGVLLLAWPRTGAESNRADGNVRGRSTGDGAVASKATPASAVLQHRTRLRIYNHLLLIPGNHFRSIVRTLGLSLGVARHHLDVLTSHGLVYAIHEGGRARYYPRAESPQQEMNQLYVRHWQLQDSRQRVLRKVERLGVATPTNVAQALGMSRQLAAYHLKRLAQIGIVTCRDHSYRLARR